jgi:hypothetical protein
MAKAHWQGELKIRVGQVTRTTPIILLSLRQYLLFAET